MDSYFSRFGNKYSFIKLGTSLKSTFTRVFVDLTVKEIGGEAELFTAQIEPSCSTISNLQSKIQAIYNLLRIEFVL